MYFLLTILIQPEALMQISMQKQHPTHNVVPFAHFLNPEEGLDTSLEEMNGSAASFLCQLSHKVSSLAFTGSMSSKSYQLRRRRWKLEIMNLRLLLLKRVLWNNIESSFSLRILGSYSYQLRTFVLYPPQ